MATLWYCSMFKLAERKDGGKKKINMSLVVRCEFRLVQTKHWACTFHVYSFKGNIPNTTLSVCRPLSSCEYLCLFFNGMGVMEIGFLTATAKKKTFSFRGIVKNNKMYTSRPIEYLEIFFVYVCVACVCVLTQVFLGEASPKCYHYSFMNVFLCNIFNLLSLLSDLDGGAFGI